MNVIANTTVISNFATVGRIDLLHNLLTEVHISTEVFSEILDGITEGVEHYRGIEAHVYPLTPDGWLHLTPLQGDEELRIFNRFPSALHRGEASSLAIAAQRRWVFLTDDFQARKAARSLGVSISGTLGVLIEAVKRALISRDEADALLNQMITAGYRSPHGTVSELL